MSDEFWEAAAQRDPLWAILSDSTKKGRRWTTGEFFETGRREISLLMYQLRQLGHTPVAGRALDFGCGIGRLSQALGAYFAEVVGIDVSPTMIQLAERANSARDRVRYVLNRTDDLQRFASGSFDFIYSDIVLQHLPPERAQGFIEEFVRLVKVGGIVVFQITSHRRSRAEALPFAVPMDDRAYRAQLMIVEEPPSSMEPRGRSRVLVRIENVSRVTWHQTAVGPIRFGNHWLSTTGQMLVQDDGRTLVGTVISPHAPTQTSVEIEAPAEPGHFICEFDLVHEGVTWFGDRGSRTVRRPIRVLARTTSSRDSNQPAAHDVAEPPGRQETKTPVNAHLELPPADDFEIGEFPMFAIHRDAVLELLARHGAGVVYMETDDRGGPEWYGFRYYVRRMS